MAIFLQMIVGFFVAGITYWWMRVQRIRSKLKWIPETTRLPILGNALELQKPTELMKVFKKYLDQFDGLCSIELATYKFILASDPTFLEFILGKMEILNKSDEYRFLHNWLGTGLLTADAPKWKKTRKMLTPSFHFSILETFLNIFESNGDILVELLEKETKEDSVDIFPYCAMNTLDIICESAMGVSINAQRNTKSAYVHAVEEKCRLLIERSFSPIKTFNLLYLLTSDYYKELDYVKILHSHTLEVISSRKEELKGKKKEDNENMNTGIGIKKRKVFLDLLLGTTVDGRPLTDDEIREEVDTFMFAGHDTTAAALSFTLYCLSLHKDVQEEVMHEQKQIFGNERNRAATNSDLQGMKFLEMAIKESLRLYPSVPFIGRKADRDVEYKDGNIIPKGTAIIVPIYNCNRHPKYFPDPDKYNPSRFEDTTSTPPYVYLPFSAGPRNCIGQKFAWNVLKSVISKVLRNYEFLPCGHEVILAAKTVLRSENGIRVKLRKRNWDKI